MFIYDIKIKEIKRLTYSIIINLNISIFYQLFIIYIFTFFALFFYLSVSLSLDFFVAVFPSCQQSFPLSFNINNPMLSLPACQLTLPAVNVLFTLSKAFPVVILNDDEQSHEGDFTSPKRKTSGCM